MGKTGHGRGDVGWRDIAYVNTTVRKMKESLVALRPMLASGTPVKPVFS